MNYIFFINDCLRFARPSLFGTPVQEVSNHLAVFVPAFVLCISAVFLLEVRD